MNDKPWVPESLLEGVGARLTEAGRRNEEVRRAAAAPREPSRHQWGYEDAVGMRRCTRFGCSVTCACMGDCVHTECLAAPREQETTLRDWIRERLQGQCKMLSLGDECPCPLCALDAKDAEISRLTESLERATKERDEWERNAQLWQDESFKKTKDAGREKLNAGDGVTRGYLSAIHHHNGTWGIYARVGGFESWMHLPVTFVNHATEQSAWDDFFDRNRDTEKLSRVSSELEEARKLNRWVNHTMLCEKAVDPDATCACGLDAATSGEPAKKEEPTNG